MSLHGFIVSIRGALVLKDIRIVDKDIVDPFMFSYLFEILSTFTITDFAVAIGQRRYLYPRTGGCFKASIDLE